MNKTFFIGNLTKNPEEYATKDGKTICKFDIAVNRDYTNENGDRVTDFFPVIIFGRRAETCIKYLEKGNKVCICGNIQNRQYENKNGYKVTVTEIIADEVEFLTWKKQENNEESAPKKRELIKIDDNELPF